jgi:aspartate aminotransferase
MTIILSEASDRIQSSPTLALNARAAELKSEGRDIVSLSVGEPDFDTPQHIKEAAIKAIHDGKTKYTAVDGTPSLKQAVVEKFARENNLKYEPQQTLVSCGAKHSIFNLCMALLNPGDEAIIPSPYWVSYPEMVKITGAKPVFINTTIEQNYKITASQLEKAITPKTRLLFLNSPSNPSGMVYSKVELQQLAEVLLKHPKILILSDDIYEHILWQNEPFANILNACPSLYDRTIVVNGVSKAYAMTGWRIGYAAGPMPLINAMKKIQSQSTSCPCSISQAAAEVALSGNQTCIKKMVAEFKKRHDLVFDTLKTINGIKVIPSNGTFYSFPDMQSIIDSMENINSDLELSEYLLNEAGVALVPGSAFGVPGAVRISYAINIEVLADTLAKIKECI